MAESQPPEALRKIAERAIDEFVKQWNGEPGYAEDLASAVLAALFDACEVREAYCNRYSDPSGGSVDYPADSAEQALASVGKASGFVDVTALRWLVIETEREPVSSTGEETGRG